jgi:hypothetical protein
MVLIGLLAKKRYGKDTIADYLVSNHRFKKVSLAHPLKIACKTLFGFTDRQLYGQDKEVVDPYWGVSPRVVFQYLGTEVFRRDIEKIIPNIKDNFWINNVENMYLKAIKENSNEHYVISDVRFQNEVDIIHKHNGLVFKLDRDINSENIEDQHESEKNIDLIIDYDTLLINNGTIDELFKKVDILIDEYQINVDNE